MSLHPHFTLVGIEPGIVITFQFGAVDFRETIPLEILEKLYNDGFPYLKLTKQGQKAMNPTIQPLNPPTTQPINPSTTQPINPNPKTLTKKTCKKK
jgi:hypothetical protein